MSNLDRAQDNPEIITREPEHGGGILSPGMAPKITTWAKEPTITQLKEDLEGSKQTHDAFVRKVKRWNNLMKVEGEAKPKAVAGRSSVQPKMIRRQAEWRYSALTEPFLGSEKLFDVSPTTFEDEQGARQNELVLNWQFRTKLNRVNFIDKYVRANVDEGSAIVRLGWKRITKTETKEVPVWGYMEVQSEEEVQALDAAIQAKNTDPRTFEETYPEEMKEAVRYFEETQMPNVAIIMGTEEVQVPKIIDNRPIIELVDPENFYIDPSCGDDIEKAHFCVISFETSKAEMLKEPDRYKNIEYVNWESATVMTSVDHKTQTPDVFNFKDTLRKRVVAYEYWGWYDVNGDNELVPIVATWVGDTLVRMEMNPFPDQKLPFIISNYMPIKRELMGEPDAELIEDNQKILGALTRGMIDLMGRSANGQQGMAKGMLDVVNRRRFEQGQDYEYNPSLSPNQGLIEHKYPDIPISAMNMITLQNQEAEALTGAKSFSGGLSGEAYGDVAAGIRGALDAASKREMAILRRLAKGIIDIGKKIIAMNQIFLSEEEVIRVTNEQFVTVKREDLAGDYDLEVDISTAEIDNNKAQDLGFMLQTMGNNMDFGITQIILVEIARLKRMPVLAERIKQFQPQPDPMVQQLQMLEIEAKKKEIEKLQSEIELNMARAQREANTADQIDLATTEQETGTTHEREMQKQRGQAEGNQNLEVTKALVKPKKTKDGGEKDPDIEAAVGFNQLTKADQGTGFGADAIKTFDERNRAAELDPRLSVGSKYFDPQRDPALNPSITL